MSIFLLALVCNECLLTQLALVYSLFIKSKLLILSLIVNPLAPKYPHNSPYAFSENRVIDRIELEGLETATITLSSRATILFVSAQVGVTVAVAPDGIALFVTPEAGLGAGISPP